MATEINLHTVQAIILRNLLFKTAARFSELNTTELTNDHFTFHVKKLIDDELIFKDETERYQLTIKGKEFANRLDTDEVVIERQAKIGVLLIAYREETEGQRQFLIQQRLKQPFYGFYGFPTGKIRWGETITQTAQRELAEETGLQGDVIFLGIKHKMDYTSEHTLLEDKYFFVCTIKNPTGLLMEEFEGGRNLWLTREEITTLPDLFPAVDEWPSLIDSPSLIFIETQDVVEKY